MSYNILQKLLGNILKQTNKAIPKSSALPLKKKKKPLPQMPTYSTKQFFGGALRDTIKKTSAFAPGGKLAEGLGYSLAAPGLAKQQEATRRSEEELYQKIVKKRDEAKTKGDVKQVKNLDRVLSKYKFSDIMSPTMKDAPTGKQVLASAGELALTAAMGLKTKLPASASGKLVSAGKVGELAKATKLAQAATKVERLKNAGVAGKVFWNVAPKVVEVGKQSFIGGTMFGAAKATEKGATTEDIIKSAESGAKISGGITVGSQLLGGGLGLFGKYAKPKIGAGWEKVTSGLEKTAAVAQTVSVPKGTKIPQESQVEKIERSIGMHKTIKQKAAGGALKVVTEGRKMKMRFLDRYSALKRIEDKTLRTTGGKPLPQHAQSWKDAQLLDSISNAKAEIKANYYLDDITNKHGPKISRKSTDYLVQLDYMDRARMGQKVPTRQNIKELKEGLVQMVDDFGPDDMKKVGEVRKKTNAFNSAELEEGIESGVYDRKLVNKLKTTHPNYIPHDVILEEDVKRFYTLKDSLNVSKTDIQKAVGSLNVSKTDIQKAVGSFKEIKDPRVAMVKRIQFRQKLFEKNKLLNNLMKTQEEFNVMPGAKKIVEGTKTPTGFGSINLYRNGARETWQVPEDVAVAIKNIDTPLTPGWWRVATAPQRILKKLATTHNPSFTLPNKLRDKQTAALTSQGFIDDFQKRYGFAKNNIDLSKMSKKQVEALYKKSGGFGSSIFQEGEETIVKNAQKSGKMKVLSAANPKNIIEKVNESVEQSTRMNVFKKAINSGVDAKTAALVSRNASIDFAKMGTWMRPLNQAIPFLNARVQGLANIPKALVANPEAFARMQMYTAVYPTLALHTHNTRFDSYGNISPYIKSKYWVIMTGEKEGTDKYTGQPMTVPQFITVPKGEGQQMVANPVQWYIERQEKIDNRKVKDLVVDTLGSASPIEFTSFNKGNPFLSLMSQFGPVATTVTGMATNIDPYYGTKIVPESREKAPPELQYKTTTPELLKTVGKKIGFSPEKLNFAIKAWGGVPQDVMSLMDIAYSAKTGKPSPKEKSFSETPFGAATQVPLIRRFVRESSEFQSPESLRIQRERQKIEQGVEGKNILLLEESEKYFTDIEKIPTTGGKLGYIRRVQKNITPEVQEKILDLRDSRRSVGDISPNDIPEVKVKLISDKLKTLPPQEQEKYYEQLVDNGIVSTAVHDRLVNKYGDKFRKFAPVILKNDLKTDIASDYKKRGYQPLEAEIMGEEKSKTLGKSKATKLLWKNGLKWTFSNNTSGDIQIDPKTYNKFAEKREKLLYDVYTKMAENKSFSAAPPGIKAKLIKYLDDKVTTGLRKAYFAPYNSAYKAKEILILSGMSPEEAEAKSVDLFVKKGVMQQPMKQTKNPTLMDAMHSGSSINFRGTGSNTFPQGECTWYVAQKVGGVPWHGDAKNWLGNAVASGHEIGTEPRVGSIMATNEDPNYGHVTYVEKVEGNTITISEMNYLGHGIVGRRKFRVGDPRIRGFIY